MSHHSPPTFNLFQHQGLLTLHIRWPKYWSFSFNISSSKEHPGLISFRMDLLDLFAVQGTLKSLLQFRWVYLSFSPLSFTSLLFPAFCKPSSDNHFAFLHFFFLGMALVTISCTMLWTSVHKEVLQALCLSDLLGRKDTTNLDSVLKNRDITLPTKVDMVDAMVFQ